MSPSSDFAPSLALLGLFLVSGSLLIFLLADYLLRSATAFRQVVNFDRPLLDRSLRLLTSIPLRAAGLVRATSLTLALWFTDIFANLASGSPEMASEVGKNTTLSLVAVALGLVQYTTKNLSRSGEIAALTLSTIGFLSFGQGLLLLNVALFDPRSFKALVSLFSSPAWFLDPVEQGRVLVIGREYFGRGGLLFGVVPVCLFLYVYFSSSSLRSSQAIGARIGVAIFAVWLVGALLQWAVVASLTGVARPSSSSLDHHSGIARLLVQPESFCRGSEEEWPSEIHPCFVEEPGFSPHTGQVLVPLLSTSKAPESATLP